MSNVIYLDHPQHGAHTVSSESEAKELEKKGWVVRPKDWVHPKLRKADPAPAEPDDAA